MQSKKPLPPHRAYKLSEWEISRGRIITLSLQTGHEGIEEITCPKSHQSLQLSWKSIVQYLNNNSDDDIYWCYTEKVHKQRNSIISLSLYTILEGPRAQVIYTSNNRHTPEPSMLSAQGFLTHNSSAIHQQGHYSKSLKTVSNVGLALRTGKDSVFSAHLRLNYKSKKPIALKVITSGCLKNRHGFYRGRKKL